MSSHQNENKFYTEFDEFLEHYASKYYDPVKAHEYYMRTRELKNQRAAESLKNAKQREIWQVSKDSIAKAKAAEVKTAQDAMKTASENTKRLTERYKAQVAAKREKLAEEVKKLNLPSTTPPKVQSFLARQLSNKIQTSQRLTAQEGKKLNDTIQSVMRIAQETYTKRMKEIQEKYKRESDTEYANIRNSG